MDGVFSIYEMKATEKFAEITKRNVGQRVGIYLDGALLTVPVVKVPITDGRAIICGSMEVKEAKTTGNKFKQPRSIRYRANGS